MPGPSKKPGFIKYNNVWIPADTPMRAIRFQNPDGTVTTRMVPVADKQLHTDYIAEKDRRYLFSHPHAGGMSTEAAIGAAVLRGSNQGQASSPNEDQQQMNISKGYNAVNGFGRNNKARTR